MAKSVHSKRRKRNQSIKRKVLYEKQYKTKLNEVSNRLMKRTFGKGDDLIITNKKNAFRYPKDPEAIFPQQADPTFVDRRTCAIPREFLVKERGMKNKKLKKLVALENLNSALKDIDNKYDGKPSEARENEVIDLNKMVKLDEFGNIDVSDELNMEKFDLLDKKSRKKKEKKNKDKMMEVDVEDGAVKSSVTRRSKKTKKKKSFYIVNF